MSATNTFTSTCATCGATIHTVRGRTRPHGCPIRLLGRLRRKGYDEGWHSGYRWAAENPDDDLVAADREDYGTGWAAIARDGWNLRVRHQ